MSAREAETTGGWTVTIERKSNPIESRYNNFFWNWEGAGVVRGCGVTEGDFRVLGGFGGTEMVVLEENAGKWRVLDREMEGK